MSWLTGSFKDAFSFLTVVPFPCPVSGPRNAARKTDGIPGEEQEEPVQNLHCPLTGSGGSVTQVEGAVRETSPAQRMGQALAWFPLVGAFVGAVGGAVVFFGSAVWPVSVAAVLGLGTMVWLTGGLHLDGFADAVDGLAVPRSAAEAHRVMVDPRLGALGTVGLVLLLLFKWVLLQSIVSSLLVGALVTACVMGRWAMVLSAQLFQYVPGETGLGRLVTDHKAPWPVAIASLMMVVGVISLWGLVPSLLLIGLTVAVVGGLNRFFLVRLQGITGDTLGAVNEVVEVVLLLTFALR